MAEESFISISKIGAKNFGKPVKCRGVIVSTSKVKDICTEACFLCKRCGSPILIVQDGEEMELPQKCNRPACRKGVGEFEFDPEGSQFNDYQEIYVQELQRDMNAGRIPKNVEVRIIGEQVNRFKAGDEVVVDGYVHHKISKQKSLIFTPYIRSVDIIRLNKIPEDIVVTEEDKQQFIELSKNPLLYQIFIESIAPHLKGMKSLKTAILYAIFGGVRVSDRHNRKRGDINILFIGDPSVGKSELLMDVVRIVPRGIYTSGKGSSAAGLTATVTKSKSGNWMLEAGALIIGDKGVVCIDEIDKMRNEDRDSIHVAMEQQKIPINKAGINTVLDARNTIIAACNPTYGYYDDSRDISENIGKLDPALLTRFDLIFVIRDTPDEKRDKQIFKFILGINEDEDTIDSLEPKFIKKYIAYAKTINPVILGEAQRHIEEFAQVMRKRSQQTQNKSLLFTYRLLQGLMRLTEAHARVRLSETADVSDADAAISIMTEYLYDVGLAESSQQKHAIANKRQQKEALFNIIVDLAQKETEGVSEELLIKEANTRHNIPIFAVSELIFILKEKEQKIFEPKTRHYLPMYSMNTYLSKD